MGKYFGTDGIRGEAYVDLTPDLALRVGKAFGCYLRELYPDLSVEVAIGKDTRLSGDMIENSLVSGLITSGVSVQTFGIVPTPAVSRLVPRMGLQAGIVISASHNPIRDNGIKLFDGKGYKLSDSAEARIETLMDNPEKASIKPSGEGTLKEAPDAPSQYVSSVVSLYPRDMLKGIKIVADCAHGATYWTTPTALSELGAQVTAINKEPDGNKINVLCGSTHPENLRSYTRENKVDFDVGLAHDGDGDRVFAFDRDGTLIDGDIMMSFCALDRHNRAELSGNGVVGTIMTNEGIIDFLKSKGISLYRSDVGDKFVLRDMMKLNFKIGGEQSGHLIFLDYVQSGDGLITILEYIRTLIRSNFTILHEKENIHFYHQKLTNLKVQDQFSILESPQFQTSLQKITASAPQVRINVRPSGTEPLIRILTEARKKEDVESIAQEISALVQSNQSLP